MNLFIVCQMNDLAPDLKVPLQTVELRGAGVYAIFRVMHADERTARVTRLA